MCISSCLYVHLFLRVHTFVVARLCVMYFYVCVYVHLFLRALADTSRQNTPFGVRYLLDETHVHVRTERVGEGEGEGEGEGGRERERLTAFAGTRAAAERGFGPGGVGAPFGRHTSAHSPSLVGLGGRAPTELPAALVADEAGRFPRHQFGRSSLNLDEKVALSIMVVVGFVVCIGLAGCAFAGVGGVCTDMLLSLMLLLWPLLHLFFLLFLLSLLLVL